MKYIFALLAVLYCAVALAQPKTPIPEQVDSALVDSFTATNTRQTVCVPVKAAKITITEVEYFGGTGTASAFNLHVVNTSAPSDLTTQYSRWWIEDSATLTGISRMPPSPLDYVTATGNKVCVTVDPEGGTWNMDVRVYYRYYNQ